MEGHNTNGTTSHTTRDSWGRVACPSCGRHLCVSQGGEVPRFRQRHPEDELEGRHRLVADDHVHYYGHEAFRRRFHLVESSRHIAEAEPAGRVSPGVPNELAAAAEVDASAG